MPTQHIHRMTFLDKYEQADTAFRTGTVHIASDEELLEYIAGLANLNNINDGTKHRDIIRGLTINNILLKRHIDKLQNHITTLDAKNLVTTFAVIALTVASLIGTGIQTWYGYKADRRSEAEAKTTAERPQMPSLSLAKPYLPSAPVSAPSIPGSGAAKK